MSQHDLQALQEASPVKSFALHLDSDSEAGSVYSNGIDSPPQELKPEGRSDSARRATLAALGLVPGPPPPVTSSPANNKTVALTPRNSLLSQQISPSASGETSPRHGTQRQYPGRDSGPGPSGRGPQGARPPGSSFGISPFSKVSENMSGLVKPGLTQASESPQVCSEAMPMSAVKHHACRKSNYAESMHGLFTWACCSIVVRDNSVRPKTGIQGLLMHTGALEHHEHWRRAAAA